MKNFFYLSLFIVSVGFIQPSNAQVSVNVNIGSQPLWGPVGYDYVSYYYMPEVNVYYNVANRRYTYWKGNRWVTKSSLPREYRHVDLYRTYKVVVNERDPWRNHNRMRNRYGRYNNGHSQVVLRDVRRPDKSFKHYKNKEKGKRHDRGRSHRRD